MYEGDFHNVITSTGKFSQYVGHSWKPLRNSGDTSLRHNHSAPNFQISMAYGPQTGPPDPLFIVVVVRFVYLIVPASVDYVEICTLHS